MRSPTKNRSSRSRRRARRGGVYLVVLMSALVIAAICLSTLQLMRVQSSVGSDTTSFIEARIVARAAIDIGMLKIQNDSNWRTDLGNGTWINNQTLGDGTYSLTATDPIDNDVTKGDNHPVILTGTGKVDGATFMTSARLEVNPNSSSCLEISMCSGNDTTVNSATVTSDQTAAANHNFNAT